MESAQESQAGLIALSELTHSGELAQDIVDRMQGVSSAARESSTLQLIDVWSVPKTTPDPED